MNSERVLVGRYRVGRLIGRGGMAEVHAGWDVRLNREVAIKVLRADLARDSAFLIRFRREAKSAAGLNHPSIVAVYDSGEDSTVELGGADLPVPFIVMEYVHGKTLRELVHERGGPLEPLEAARVMASTLRALGYSHAHGIVHRDIKPANVMVAASGAVKLTDFGIARAIADTAATLTNTAVVVGTAQYLSPEQAQGHAIDPRTDIYAAGCVLYELLTARPPFVGDSPLAIAYQHVGTPAQRPSTYAPHVHSDLDAVTLRALAKAPADRYASAGEFATDLESLAAGNRPSEAALATLAAPNTSPDTGEGPPVVPPVDPPAVEDSQTSSFPPITARRPRRRFIAVLALLIAALVVVLGVLAAQGRLGTAPGVTVPDIRTKTLQSAQDELTAAGFAPEPRYISNKAARDVVVAQSPDGGREAPGGSRVTLDVSSGPGNVTVPDLFGWHRDEASAKLEARNLQVSWEYVDSYELGADAVVSTDPPKDTVVQEGTRVTVRVSTGKVKVPNLVGVSESEARATLTKLGLRLEVVVVNAGGAPGKVIQHEYSGMSVPQGTTVKAVVVAVRPAPLPTVTQTVTVQPTTPPPASPTTSLTTRTPTETVKPEE
ncbi:MAG: Stk1 family PASTA domain-containing Ser/Thr kinase [Dermatophilaceae bacterium]